ncbi:MAG: NAD(P)/FAD-dependent oxidoreductase [Pseudomonadota bacterium]
MNCQVLISGAGPSGVAAGILLAQLGWREIVIVERRAQQQGFDRERAFNYQLEGRGQALLERIGITQATMAAYGLPNDHFTLTRIAPGAQPKVITPPILVPDRQTPYWMTRTRLMAMLDGALQPHLANGAIRLLEGHRFAGFADTATGQVARVRTTTGEQLEFRPRLLLGCDGLHSQVRRGLVEHSDELASRFYRVTHPSPSADLAYKVLNLPPSFDVQSPRCRVDDHAMAYAFTGRDREADRRMALFALPVATAEDPRTVNIILPRNHRFWDLEGVPAISEWLREHFPQFDVPAVAGAAELAAFADAERGQFPQPQYTRHIYTALNGGSSEQAMHCVLLGDAAHAFPPDLGMGVNSALEDVARLEAHLSPQALGAGLRAYAAEREPEHAALVRLVQRVHPYQYNQVPWRLKLWTARFLFQLLLHRGSRGLIEMPGFMLSQLHRISFTEMEQRFQAGNRAVQATLLGLALVGAAALA